MHDRSGLAQPRLVERLLGPRVTELLRAIKRRLPLPFVLARRFLREVWPTTRLVYDTSQMKPGRQTILLIVHQATRTGAPILAYNLACELGKRHNIVALLLAGGDLVSDFRASCSAVVGPLSPADWRGGEIDRVIASIIRHYDITFAIANTIDTRLTLEPLTLSLVPVVILVHEFASHLRPAGEMGRALEWATEIVFPAEIVRASVRAEYPNLDGRPTHILPQGPCRVPPREATGPALPDEALGLAVRPPPARDALVVLGCGTVTFRKGIDVFLSCAAAVKDMPTRRPVRFVWIGRGTSAEADRQYAIYLDEQIARCGLQDTVAMLDEVGSLEAAYAAADLFFLSSRLDPLPNVCIDAALRGIPIVCFENASGFSDILREREAARSAVVPHLDYRAAAQLIVRLANDETERLRLGRETQALARTLFDLERYVSAVEEIGLEAVRKIRQRRSDLETIHADGSFDTCMFLGRAFTLRSRKSIILRYLARSAAFGRGREPSRNFYYRRPCAGFHPQIYSYERDLDSSVDPLAHFIRSGKPTGPWSHDVITPQNATATGAGPDLRVGLHGHFHYPELIGDFLSKVAPNTSRLDLLLSTDTQPKKKRLEDATRGYTRGRVVTRLVPNRGRDIGAFLTAFGSEIAGDYDVVGHIHSKQSLFLGNTDIGKRWREFLWQHLLGARYPMIDIILGRFVSDASLGIVFPEEAHLADWDLNREIAQRLAARMGFAGELPPFFDFPVGTMFWARARALQPLIGLGLDWNDYPAEPLPIDGTILHAIERLLPFAARHMGFKYATTYIKGLTW
jgi:glycosyltransferase involved in cell wall biosynthesis